jgi:hypothetical protein
MSTTPRSSPKLFTVSAWVVYLEWRAIERSSSMTQTGMPCRPRLRTMPRPW